MSLNVCSVKSTFEIKCLGWFFWTSTIRIGFRRWLDLKILSFFFLLHWNKELFSYFLRNVLDEKTNETESEISSKDHYYSQLRNSFFAHLRIWRDCVRRDWHTNNLKIEIFLILLSLFFSPSIFFQSRKWLERIWQENWVERERERRRNKEIKILFLFSREICPLFCVSMKKICFNKLYISHTRLFLYLAAKN
jgi:hypothetical protein